MSNVSFNLPPGFYVDPIELEWNFSSNVQSVAFSTDGMAPSISEYIAYDEHDLPFIAVTQDGRGNVVYDGGFPKYVNSRASELIPEGTTDFSGLSGAGKFFINTLNWIADPAKTSIGNRNVLVLGDNISGDPYYLHSTFNTSVASLIEFANFVPTFKAADDWVGNELDARLSELENYAAVIVLSIRNTTLGLITDNCTIDLKTYRENGGGLYIITDHGPDISDINNAYPPSDQAFFATANKISVQFGAWFSGSIDRSPVNVGFLRSTYGDHPLYNNIGDEEFIPGGGSESRTYVSESNSMGPSEVPSINISEPGIHQIRVLLVLDDNTTEAHTFAYGIATGDIIEVKDENDNVLSEISTGISKTLPILNVEISAPDLGTINGNILLNSNVIGSISYVEGTGTSVVWNDGDSTNVNVNDGDDLIFSITSPFEYSTTLPISRFQPNIGSLRNLADVVSAINAIDNGNPLTAIRRTISEINGEYSLNISDNIRQINEYLQS